MLRPVEWAWSAEWHLVDATFIDYNRVLCNVSAGLYASVGDATLGVTLQKDNFNSPYQVGPPFTFYDPARPA